MLCAETRIVDCKKLVVVDIKILDIWQIDFISNFGMNIVN